MNTTRRLVTSFLAALGTPFGVNAQVGRDLRLMFLATSAATLGVKPTVEYPRVIGVAMDWPIGEQTATIVSLFDGTASLYTTSTFGIIGGVGHASVRTAAQRFVKAADKHFADASPTSSHPYPGKNKVRFNLVTFDGVRAIETDAQPVYSGSGKYSALFGEGQSVLTELRKVTEQKR